jgi:uncharacterized protein YqeY
MTTLRNRITDDLHAARAAKAHGDDSVHTADIIRTLSVIDSELTRAETAGKTRSTLTDAEVVAVLRKLPDARRSNAAVFVDRAHAARTEAFRLEDEMHAAGSYPPSCQQLADAGLREAADFDEKARAENAEAGIIEAYLPQMLGTTAVVRIVVETINQIGATSMRDMGKVMGALKRRDDAGTIDMSKASDAARVALA